MKAFVFALLLSCSTAVRADKPKPNPADFTVTVHVLGSHYRYGFQYLETGIDGKMVELQSADPHFGVLALGDYKAQSVTTGYIPKHPNGYDIFLVYRFLLPDGAMRDYEVFGFGASSHFLEPSKQH